MKKAHAAKIAAKKAALEERETKATLMLSDKRSEFIGEYMSGTYGGISVHDEDVLLDHAIEAWEDELPNAICDVEAALGFYWKKARRFPMRYR